jgi:predicted transporter
MEYLTAGILIGMAVLSLKAGLGCGLSGLRKKEILGFAGIYAIAAFILGGIAGVVSQEVSEQIMALGLIMHLIIAAGLIFFGIQTRKNWLSGKNDLSRHTFLWLSLPCPACIIATFLACLVLSDITGITGLEVGAVIGAIFFCGILVASFSVSYLAALTGKKNPSTLGSVMIMLGLFYFLCPLLIPAYIQAQGTGTLDVAIQTGDMGTGILLICIPVAAGYFTDRIMRKKLNWRQ